MNNLCKLSLALCALVGGTAFVTTTVVRAQDKTGEKQDDGGMGFDPALMMKMMELATPGKPHEDLAKRAGKWETSYKMRMSPDAPWMEAKGTSEGKLMLGGRYLMEESTFEIMGMPMSGVSLLGYDNNKQEYISLWMDTMSTWWITSRGAAAANGVIETKGTMIDVAGERPFRMVLHPMQADGSQVAEMFDTIPPVGDVKVMEITYRKKS